MSATADIFDQREDWRGPIGLSVTFHAVLFGSILLYAAFHGGSKGDNWGGAASGGEAMNATLVSSAAIPLPVKPAEQQNVLANESTGVSQSLPKQKVEEKPEAIPIPDRETKKVKKEKLTATNTRPPQVQPEPTNVVPFGEGGAANSVRFSTSSGSGGIGMSGVTGGDFGSRYAWYVDKVRRVISENWLKYEVGPNVQSAARVYLTFDITRDGRPANVQLEQSSHIPSLDYSAINALKRIDSFGPLPPDYAGNKVSVEFFFDYKR
jgi:periplasmic protein TonB